MSENLSTDKLIPTKVAEEQLLKLFSQVEAFIQRVYDKDWEIHPDARLIKVKEPITKQSGSISDLLGSVISEYQDRHREEGRAILQARDELEESMRKERKLDDLQPTVDALVTLVILKETVYPKTMLKEVTAEKLLDLINIAFAHGVVIEGQGLTRKLKECQENTDRLTTDNRTLSEAYKKVTQDFAEYRKRIQPTRNGVGEGS